jgi:hypothetical protein
MLLHAMAMYVLMQASFEGHAKKMTADDLSDGSSGKPHVRYASEKSGCAVQSVRIV